METITVNSTKDQLEEFKKSVLWNDIVTELLSWKEGFNREMASLVDDTVGTNESTASILMHIGDLNGRQKAVDYMIGLPDVLLSVLEGRKKRQPKSEETENE